MTNTKDRLIEILSEVQDYGIKHETARDVRVWSDNGVVANHLIENGVTVSVTGHWVRLDAHKGMEQFKCSICRSECYVPTCMNEPMYEYCPNCGTKMKGEKKDHAED